MKCDACGAPVENGKCTYCGKVFENNKSEKDSNDIKPNDEMRADAKHKGPFWKKTGFVVWMCILMPYIGVFLLWMAKKPLSISKRILLTIVLVLYSTPIILACFGNTGEDQTGNNSIWLEGYTDIDDFDYYMDGNEIFLTDFNSSEKKVRINSSYEIEDSVYYVVSLDGVFARDNVKSVIIPEGVHSVGANEFNSSGVKFLYLPSTLQDIGDDSFWGCFRDAEKIYYGGSKEQWEQLCTVERSEIDVKQIVYDASPDDLK